LQVENTDTATHSILIVYGATGFTTPVTPPAIKLDSNFSGTSVPVSTQANNLLSFQSYVDEGNNLGHLAIPGTYTAGLQTVNATQDTFTSDSERLISPLSGPYSIAQELNITLGGLGQLNTADNTNLSSVPEPVSFALLGIGLSGLLTFRRFFKRTSVA
jgi:hypothetical protein